MVDHWIITVAVVAVDLDASATLQQRIAIHLHRRLREQLVPSEVRVVAGVDEVVRQRLCHVHRYAVLLRVEPRILINVKQSVLKLS